MYEKFSSDHGHEWFRLRLIQQKDGSHLHTIDLKYLFCQFLFICSYHLKNYTERRNLLQKLENNT